MKQPITTHMPLVMFILCSLWVSALFAGHHVRPTITWHPSFYAIQPRTDIAKPVDMAFCLTHSPNVLSVTIDQITAKQGARAENGVYIRYDRYNTEHHHGLGLITVNGDVWTTDLKGSTTWSSPIWLYEQNLSDTGITNTVWATEQCKGKFVGIASSSNHA
jgi:hypothetical protein